MGHVTAPSRIILAALCAATLALVSLPGALAASETTAPSYTLYIYVQLTDRGTKLLIFARGNDDGTPNLVPESSVLRGQVARFIVRNYGNKPHNFRIFGHTTPILKHGKKADITIAFISRGKFPYSSPTNAKVRAFSGFLTVN